MTLSRLFYSTCFVFFATLLFSYKYSAENEKGLPQKQVVEYYKLRIQILQESFSNLQKFANQLSAQGISSSNLKDAFLRSRIEYKKVELLLAYFDSYSSSLLNAPALPKISYYPTNIKEPHGYQVLEELIFDENPYNNREQILYEIETLKQSGTNAQKFINEIIWNDMLIFESIRHNYVRIVSLSLSGFDSPVAKLSFIETKASLEATKKILAFYYPLLSSTKDKRIGKSIDKRLTQATSYLERNVDFISFDRAYFIITYINPLYKELRMLQEILKIDFLNSKFKNNTALNSQAENIFSEDFLNPFFFSYNKMLDYNKEMFDLGKVLFFDPILSSNNKRSCASCHSPDKGFTDNSARSLTFDFKGKTLRNSPTLANAAFQNIFLWDGRVNFIEDQFHHVIFNPEEMGSTSNDLISRINQSEEYVQMFRAVFKLKKESIISINEIQAALGMYARSLTALDSPFDKFIRGETKLIDPSIKRGFNLFMGKGQCGTCHFAPIFNGTVPPNFEDTETEVLGVPSSSNRESPKIDGDVGRFTMGGVTEHDHSFKTPTVRNASLTAPYMHNGVYNTLEEVMDFYNNGGGVGLGLDVPNQTLPTDSLHLTSTEINDIISFMKSLTDTSGTTSVPSRLPSFDDDKLNARRIGGEY